MANVIVADDETLLRWALVQRLVRDGHRVTEAADGGAALAALATVAAPTVMVLDLKLPDMTGLAVLAQIRKLRPDVGVVMMTAYWASEAYERARRMGVRDLLAKPLNLDRVAAAVAAAKGDRLMLTLTRILCPTDFSDVSTAAETCAIALAGHYDASLHLLHVDPPTPVLAPYGEIPVDIRLFEEQRTQAEQDMAAARERARAAGVAAEATVRGGHPAREILACADELQADLIVLGTHGRGGVEHLLLGSVAEKVMRKAECPVMIVPAGAVGVADVLFARILCPVDGSASSADAVSYALSLARETDGRLTLLSVVEPVPTGGEFGALDAEEYRRLGEVHAQTVLQQALAPEVLDWCQVDEVVAVGKASERILATAADTRAQVIVMGVRGRGAIDLLAFGSTTNDVIRRATCPVLAVHPHVEDRRRLAALPVAATG